MNLQTYKINNLNHVIIIPTDVGKSCFITQEKFEKLLEKEKATDNKKMLENEVKKTDKTKPIKL